MNVSCVFSIASCTLHKYGCDTFSGQIDHSLCPLPFVNPHPTGATASRQAPSRWDSLRGEGLFLTSLLSLKTFFLLLLISHYLILLHSSLSWSLSPLVYVLKLHSIHVWSFYCKRVCALVKNWVENWVNILIYHMSSYQPRSEKGSLWLCTENELKSYIFMCDINSVISVTHMQPFRPIPHRSVKLISTVWRQIRYTYLSLSFFFSTKAKFKINN